MITFLAWQSGRGEAQILSCINFKVLESRVPIGAPEGIGLHCWRGVMEDGRLVGQWARATAQDLIQFQVPLSENCAGDGAEGYCCRMRQKFLVGILGEDVGVEAPLELADFVVNWEPKPCLSLRFCPFCGTRIPPDAKLRVLG